MASALSQYNANGQLVSGSNALVSVSTVPTNSATQLVGAGNAGTMITKNGSTS
jgi:hypothetical protein